METIYYLNGKQTKQEEIPSNARHGDTTTQVYYITEDGKQKSKKSVKPKRPVFATISRTEMIFTYHDIKFLLKTQKQGVYGMGSSMFLYELEGINKKPLRNIGWTETDGGYNTHTKGEAFLGRGLFTTEQCKEGALRFIDAFLG